MWEAEWTEGILAPMLKQTDLAAEAYTTTWKYTSEASANPLEWNGSDSFRAWICALIWLLRTNFLIVQRAFAAESKTAARKVPLIGAIPKMFIPFLIIIPGIIAIVLTKILQSLLYRLMHQANQFMIILLLCFLNNTFRPVCLARE